jgi:hypothetical protein
MTPNNAVLPHEPAVPSNTTILDTSSNQNLVDLVSPMFEVYQMDCEECQMRALAGKHNKFPKKAMDKCLKMLQKGTCARQSTLSGVPSTILD